MRKNLTELVFILDRSGSMTGLESDTIGGYNAMLEKQRKEEGEAFVTTILFDDDYEILHNRVNIKRVKPITDREYYVRGMTALLDAVGKTINKTVKAIIKSDEEEQPSNVMFVIITDGMENASREYSYDKIKQMIEHEKKKYSWEFIFLGANIDAIATAAKFGIDEDKASNYHADSLGTMLNFESVSDAVSNFRSGISIDKNWKENIELDYEARRKEKN